jgi:hypothetical protein
LVKFSHNNFPKPVLLDSTEEYKTTIISVLAIYNLGGFQIHEIHYDNKFNPIMDQLAIEIGIYINYANPQEHEAKAKCNNPAIKEQI